MNARRGTTNVAASIRDRLKNAARAAGIEFQRALSEYATERFLSRLGESRHKDAFVLKGAMLFRVWTDNRHRATWDLDLLGRGVQGVADVANAVRDVCSVPRNDGIRFDADSANSEVIRAAGEEAGVRVHFNAYLADARIPMQIDVGYGDVIVPSPQRVEYPTLLGHAPPLILAYPRETAIAEKVEAMTSLGVTNSRMKDFYDVHVLAARFGFDGETLGSAMRATFARRGTPVPEAGPVALAPGFLEAPERATQWRAFHRRARLPEPANAVDLANALRRFLLPVLDAVAGGRTFRRSWPAGGPWADSQ
jgi:hypothetical protein